MTKPFEYLPAKAIRRFIIVQTLFIICLSLIYFFLENKISSDKHWVLICIFTLASILYTGIVAYVFFLPLGRLLAKAKNIKRGTYQREWDYEHEPVQDFGEWYELELTLNKINREIKKHKNDKTRREIEIETIAGSVADGVIAIDGFKRVQYFNGQMALILGKTFDPLSPPSYLDEVFRAPKLTLAVDEVIQEKASRRVQIQMRPHKSMENHVFDVLVNPIVRDKKNIFYGVMAVFHDITEAKKVEELRIDFVANASHELKTPLTSIKGYVDSLLQDFLNKDLSLAQDKLRVIERNVNKLNELVVDLLTLSRLDSGLETAKEDLMIEEVTEEVIRPLKQTWKDKNQLVEVSCSVSTVLANRVMLDQVLANLVENAMKYCQVGAKIQVVWKDVGSDICLQVRDDGPGVSDEHVNRLFERFYRVNNGKTSSGVAGTGLGLAIAKNSMLKMGGRIEVNSLPGQGTEFSCFFPKA